MRLVVSSRGKFDVRLFSRFHQKRILEFVSQKVDGTRHRRAPDKDIHGFDKFFWERDEHLLFPLSP